jgi:hypothetical protein
MVGVSCWQKQGNVAALKKFGDTTAFNVGVGLQAGAIDGSA